MSTDQPPASSRPAPPKLEGYRILGEMGRDDFGVTCKAEQITLQRPVAIRTLEGVRGLDDPEKLERLLEATRAAARIKDHTNIAKVFDVKPYGGVPCVIMECVEGETLDRKTATLGGRLKPEKAVDAAIQIARGLERAHAHGILHGALKPSSALVASGWIVKLMDFGLAKGLGFPKPESSDGVAAYMAPEVWKDGEAGADARSDVYSLAAILFQLTMGKAPFKAPDAEGMAKEHASSDPPSLRLADPEFPRELERIILKGLEKDPIDRYQSAEEFEQVLKDYAKETGFSREEDAPLRARQTTKFTSAPSRAFRPRDDGEEYPIPGDMEDIDVPFGQEPAPSLDDAPSDALESGSQPFLDDLLDGLGDEPPPSSPTRLKDTDERTRKTLEMDRDEILGATHAAAQAKIAGMDDLLMGGDADHAAMAPTQNFKKAPSKPAMGAIPDSKPSFSSPTPPPSPIKKRRPFLVRAFLWIIILAVLLVGGLAGTWYGAPAQFEQIFQAIDPDGAAGTWIAQALPPEYRDKLADPLAAMGAKDLAKGAEPSDGSEAGSNGSETPAGGTAPEGGAPATGAGSSKTPPKAGTGSSKTPPQAGAGSTKTPPKAGTGSSKTPPKAGAGQAASQAPAVPSKPVIAVADFSVQGASPAVASSLAVGLLPDFGASSFNLAQRSRVLRSLEAKGLSMADIAGDPEAAAKFAKEEGYRYIVTGSMAGTEGAWILHASLVDAETGKVAAAASIDATSVDQLRWRLSDLAQKLLAGAKK